MMAGMKDAYFGDQPYPAMPGFKTPGTSRDAARAAAPTSGTLRAAVLAAIRKAPKGLTADEVAAEIGETVLATRPRLSELKNLGEIMQTGERRRNISGLGAAVWQAKVGR